MRHLIGIGDLAISNKPEDDLVTHALGSCVAVVFHNPNQKIGGMIHIALPERKPHMTGDFKQGYYANDGLHYMIETLDMRYKFDFKSCNIHVFGGANPSKIKDTFYIGKKNLEAVHLILSKYRFKYNALETGGTVSRTVELRIGTGVIEIKRQAIIL